MKTIIQNVESEIIIKNSKFITLLIKLNHCDIAPILENVRKLYPKATHYCYAYIYQEKKKFSDDNEPGGTAGMPIMNVLEKENLNNILCIVIRYFGGIKLGAGGLVRAYTKSVTTALKKVSLIDLESGYKIKLTFPYNEEKNINYLLKDAKIIHTAYEEQITYIILISKSLFQKLDNYNPIILDEILFEK